MEANRNNRLNAGTSGIFGRSPRTIAYRVAQRTGLDVTTALEIVREDIADLGIRWEHNGHSRIVPTLEAQQLEDHIVEMHDDYRNNR